MKVSVCLPTYNHGKFIAQAIDSVLCQRTNFDFELLIGEDDSTDGTREIVLGYRERYPDRIRLFMNDRKNVIYIDGKPTGRWNLVNLLKNAQGEYISLIEGDDYWTSPVKLQRQIEFLDNHPECVICGHNAIELFEDNNKESCLMFPAGRKSINMLEEILYSNFLPTCSVVFRNHLIEEFPDWYFKVSMGDWPLYVMLAQFGNIGYIDEVMGVYRKHCSSLWANLSLKEKYLSTIKAYEYLLKYLIYDDNHIRIIKKRIADHYKLISSIYRLNGEYFKYILFICKFRLHCLKG